MKIARKRTKTFNSTVRVIVAYLSMYLQIWSVSSLLSKETRTVHEYERKLIIKMFTLDFTFCKSIWYGGALHDPCV